MPARRIFFDTNIYGDVARGKISSTEWEHVSRYVRRHFNLRISPLTLYELLNGFAAADDMQFREMQRPIKILCSPQRKKFFRLPLQFLLFDILGRIPKRLDFEPSQIELIADAVCWANNRNDLERGRVKIPGKGFEDKDYGLNLTEIEADILEGKASYVKSMQELRAGQLQRSTPETFAAAVFSRMGQPVSAHEASKLAGLLDCAYRYSESVWGFAEGKTYNLQKHSSDWVDFQQLYYLARPDTYFVSNDPDFKNRTQGSSQQDRIWTYDRLRQASEVGTPPLK